MRKYNKIFCFFVAVLLLEKSVYAYRIPEKEVREIETFDNEVCLSRGHSLDNENSIRLYWECRLSLIDERIGEAVGYGAKNAFYVKELKRIKAVIKNVIERIESDFETKRESYDKLKKQRKPVIKNIDKYYYNLLSFLSYDYSPSKVNTNRDIADIINFRKKQEEKENIMSMEEQLRKFPFCIRYDRKSKEFDNCIKENQQVELCKEMTADKLKKNENQVKFNCKKKAIEEYPDYMALYNSEFEELKSIKQDSYSFDRGEKRKIENRMQELNKLMSGPRLSKTQLINLRKYAEQKCLLDSELEKNLFKLVISDECEKLLKNIREKK
jgi:hypothetical protein